MWNELIYELFDFEVAMEIESEKYVEKEGEVF